MDDIYHGKGHTVLASLWERREGGGHAQYLAQHIPTAQFCDPTAALSGVPGSAVGRNPLPEIPNLQRSIEFWGVRSNRKVIVYDQGRGLLGARAWWILRWAGIEDVEILDGGLAAWERAKFPILRGPGNISIESNVTVRPGSMPVATIDDVRNHDGVLLDTREPNRFAGRREFLDLKAGHIPGATNLSVWDLLNDDGTFRSPEQTREIFAGAGITEGAGVIVHSGSGNHSALALAAMEHAGLSGAAHFVGGWSQWSADRDNPIELGD